MGDDDLIRRGDAARAVALCSAESDSPNAQGVRVKEAIAAYQRQYRGENEYDRGAWTACEELTAILSALGMSLQPEAQGGRAADAMHAHHGERTHAHAPKMHDPHAAHAAHAASVPTPASNPGGGAIST